ncbi:MAG TPA: acyl-CoA dehydrogenase family protein, partial [Myxococcota bacterium]|nr:acyl-CoA dehydrogenase family protein [Myxococcota bacterium]
MTAAPRQTDLDSLLVAIGRFLDEVVIPLESRFLLEGFAAIAGDLERARDEARSRGLFAPQLPVEDGGLGLSLVEVGEVSRILGRSPIGHFALHMQAPDVSNMELLHRFASESQREAFYRPLCAGRIRSCFSMTEPDHAGSNPVFMSTTATRVDGGWRIDGRKWFTSSADGAHFAVVMAVTDANAKPHERATFFIVPTDTPGFRIAQNLPVMGEAHAVGLAGWASHAEVLYEGVVIPDELRLGPVGGGFQMAQERLGPGRIHHAMRWIGITERA